MDWERLSTLNKYNDDDDDDEDDDHELSAELTRTGTRFVRCVPWEIREEKDFSQTSLAFCKRQNKVKFMKKTAIGITFYTDFHKYFTSLP